VSLSFLTVHKIRIAVSYSLPVLHGITSPSDFLFRQLADIGDGIVPSLAYYDGHVDVCLLVHKLGVVEAFKTLEVQTLQASIHGGPRPVSGHGKLGAQGYPVKRR
jgi:hypothetical protein